jgi:hypothetical protein
MGVQAFQAVRRGMSIIIAVASRQENKNVSTAALGDISGPRPAGSKVLITLTRLVSCLDQIARPCSDFGTSHCLVKKVCATE